MVYPVKADVKQYVSLLLHQSLPCRFSDDDLYVFEFEYVDGVINSINEYNYLKVEDEQILYDEVKTGIYKNGYYSQP